MSTNYQHRLLCICPDARKASLASWWDSNIDSGQGLATLSVPLSATGSLPATHWWFSGAFTVAELRKIAVQLCSLCSVTPPTLAQYNAATNAQRRQWLVDNLVTPLKNVAGVLIVPDDNEAAQWSDPEAALTLMGLQRITVTP